MSLDDLGEVPGAGAPDHTRQLYTQELNQLGLQVELLSAQVDEALERMVLVLRTGDEDAAGKALRGDDVIATTVVSLTQECYGIIAREQPVARDLRYVVSVLRVLSELERVAELSLRVVKLAPDHPLLVSNPTSFGHLLTMSDEAIALYRAAERAWAARDLAGAADLATASPSFDEEHRHLIEELYRMDGANAVAVALKTITVAQALDRIVVHARIIAARVRYLLTGDVSFLLFEVR